VDLSLRHLWNGLPAPDGAGGRARLDLGSGRLHLSWELALPGPPRSPATRPGYTDGLWEWDVVELFLRSRAPGPRRYLELEFGPGRHWLALAFAGVRRRSAELRGLAPELEHDISGLLWRGRASVPLLAVEPHAGPPPWNGLLAAVLGEPAAGRLHLTWPRLPGERPDFHKPEAWAPLELEADRPRDGRDE
jgi:hypothetical protein